MTKRPDPLPNPTIIRGKIPSIDYTIRGGRTELNPGWPLDQILEIEQAQREQAERNQRKRSYLK